MAGSEDRRWRSEYRHWRSGSDAPGVHNSQGDFGPPPLGAAGLKAATYAAAIDPETGLIDMEQLIVGMGHARRKRAKDIEGLLQEVLAERLSAGDTLTTIDNMKAVVNERLADRKEQVASEAEFMSALRACETQGLCRRQGKQIEAR